MTLAFGEIIYLVAKNWKDFTGGGAGISAPRITFFGIKFDATPNGFAAWLSWFLSEITTTFGFDPVTISAAPWHRTMFLYYVIVVLALMTAWVTLRLRRLPVGRAWEALREDEIACRSLGINTTSTKLTAFACGAFFGGLAGAFFGARQGFVDPGGLQVHRIRRSSSPSWCWAAWARSSAWRWRPSPCRAAPKSCANSTS